MTVREPSFIKIQEEEALRQPPPIFVFYGAPRSSTDEVNLVNPIKRIVFDAVLQTTTRNLFALIESWRYPVVASVGMDMQQKMQKFLSDQMQMGYPLFALRDPKNESICWQFNIRYFIPNRIEFDVLAFRGTPNNAVIILWLTHVGHLESVQLTDDTARATFYSYYDDPFVEYSTRIIAKHILSKIPALIVETSPTPANIEQPITATQTHLIDLGVPEQVVILNEPLNIGARSLFSLVLSMGNPLTLVPESFPSDDGFINESGLIDGIRWQFHHKQTSDDVMEVYALVWEERHNQEKILMDLEQVGHIYAFGVSDGGDRSQVKIVSYYRDSVICPFFINKAAKILDRVGGWERGRSEVWRKETRARIFSPAPTTGQPSDTTVTKLGDDDTDDKFIPPTTDVGKKHYKGYNRETAKQIGDAFPKAWQESQSDSNLNAKWGVTLIATHTPIAVETASRYIGVFRKAGITQIHGIALPKEKSRSHVTRRRRR